MTPARITPIALALVCAVALSGASCDRASVDYYTALLEGKAPPPTAAQVAQFQQFIAANPTVSTVADVTVVESSSSVSSEPVVTVAVVPEVVPEPVYVPEPVCVQSPWHGMEYSCDGTVSWPVGEPRPPGV